jgi:ribose 5-phosphate isomerase B
MSLFIAADHRGFELKNKLIEYLQESNIRVEDIGNYEYDPLDDYPDFAQRLAQAVLQKPDSMGIVICGSGVGVCIATNRFKGIRCALSFKKEQVEHGRKNDHINVLSIPSDYIDLETAKQLVDIFLKTQPIVEEKYQRRVHKLDSFTETTIKTSV